MGWQRQGGHNYWMSFSSSGETFEPHALIATWKPSESIEATMLVVDKMRERGWAFNIYIFPEFYNVSAFHLGTSNDITEQYLSNMRTRTEDYICESFAKALCLAALEASGVDPSMLFDLNEGNAALGAIESGGKQLG
jgi:hypothetical protein